MYCKKCGKQIEDDSDFCRHCGAGQGFTADAPVVSVAKTNSGLRCTSCGGELRRDMEICPVCGTPSVHFEKRVKAADIHNDFSAKAADRDDGKRVSLAKPDQKAGGLRCTACGGELLRDMERCPECGRDNPAYERRTAPVAPVRDEARVQSEIDACYERERAREKKKAIVGGIVGAAVLVTAVAVCAVVVIPQYNGDFELTDVEGGVAITAYNGDDVVVEIPESLHFKDVIRIDDHAFSGNQTIKAVEIPLILHQIGEGAFEDCGSLERIIVSDPYTMGLKHIEKGAFMNCVKLEEFPWIVSGGKIGESAFENCTSLNTYPGANSIGARAFAGCTKLNPSYIGASTIGEYAFEGCTAMELSRIEMWYDDGLGIQKGAFKGCTAIKDLTLLVERVGEGAFEGCTGIETLDITVCELSERVFKGCTGLKTVTVGSRYFEMLEQRLNIPSYCFEDCTSLTTVNGTGIGMLERYSFDGCKSLAKVEHDGNEAADAFRGCPKMQEAPVIENEPVKPKYPERKEHLIDARYGVEYSKMKYSTITSLLGEPDEFGKEGVTYFLDGSKAAVDALGRGSGTITVPYQNGSTWIDPVFDPFSDEHVPYVIIAGDRTQLYDGITLNVSYYDFLDKTGYTPNVYIGSGSYGMTWFEFVVTTHLTNGDNYDFEYRMTDDGSNFIYQAKITFISNDYGKVYDE